jgi:hypothetical protein
MGVVEGAAKSKSSGSSSRRVGAVAGIVALGVLAALPFVAF